MHPLTKCLLEKQTLKFNKDGTFKIIQFADIHWESTGEELDEYDQKTRLVMEKLLSIEKPDLIVFTGDIMTSGRKSPVRYSKSVADVKEALGIILKPVLDVKIPWAFTLGNHEHCHAVDVPTLLKSFVKMPMCLMKLNKSKKVGLANYLLKINGASDKKDKWILYFIDSGCKYNYPKKSYGWVERKQVEWYAKQSKRISKKNKRFVPALAFFHIPLPEFEEVWNNQICYGLKGEKVSCPVLNTGFFSEMVLNRDVKGVFVGHDHCNDYMGNLYGIELCYGRTTGHRMHKDNTFVLGARVILLNEKDEDFDTWIRLEDGTIIKQNICDTNIDMTIIK